MNNLFIHLQRWFTKQSNFVESLDNKVIFHIHLPIQRYFKTRGLRRLGINNGGVEDDL